MNKGLEIKLLEDRKYASLLSMVFAIVTVISLYFGGSNSILWLTVVGFVLGGISVLCAFMHPTYQGPIVAGIVGIFLLISLFARDFILSIFEKESNKIQGMIYTWLNGNGKNDISYVARFLVIAFIVITIYNLTSFISTSSALNEKNK